jgi:hypothetical protein
LERLILAWPTLSLSTRKALLALIRM